MHLVQHRVLLMSIALVGTGLVGSACTSSDPADETGTGGTAGTTTTGGAAGTTTTGGTAGVGGSAAGTGGTSGSGGGEVDCSAPIPVVAGLAVDFETYDGVSPATADTVNFTFGDDANGFVTLGAFELDDLTGTYFMGFIDGAEDSLWALSATNTMATDWGGGIGFWNGCMNASGTTGVTFSAKGSSGRDNIAIFAFDPGDGDYFAQEFTMSEDWSTVELPFASFTRTSGGTTDGSVIAAMALTAGVNYPTGSPEPAPYEVSIDNFGFY